MFNKLWTLNGCLVGRLLEQYAARYLLRLRLVDWLLMQLLDQLWLVANLEKLLHVLLNDHQIICRFKVFKFGEFLNLLDLKSSLI